VERAVPLPAVSEWSHILAEMEVLRVILPKTAALAEAVLQGQTAMVPLAAIRQVVLTRTAVLEAAEPMEEVPVPMAMV
jgi:hypothetical protein